MHERIAKGTYGEQCVIQYLVQKGYTIIARNYQKRWGEIDLIAHSNNLVLFIEVKMRSHKRDDFDLSEVITRSKQRKIIMVAKEYCMRHHIADLSYRFDVALVYSPHDITYLEDAFREGE